MYVISQIGTVFQIFNIISSTLFIPLHIDNSIIKRHGILVITLIFEQEVDINIG